jgi:ParB family transcriptional regulator, chromosome partitioning protein
LGLNQLEEQLALARQIVEKQLTVREAEKISTHTPAPRRTRPQQRSYVDLEEKLQKRFGTRVSIIKSRTGGKIVLHYFTPVELDRLLEMLLG